MKFGLIKQKRTHKDSRVSMFKMDNANPLLIPPIIVHQKTIITDSIITPSTTTVHPYPIGHKNHHRMPE